MKNIKNINRYGEEDILIDDKLLFRRYPIRSDKLNKLNISKRMTWLGWERFIMDCYSNEQYIDLRQIKSGMPDLYIAYPNYCFIECKNYKSYNSWKAGLYAWTKKEKRQLNRFINLIENDFTIYFYINTKNRADIIRFYGEIYE